MNEPNPETIPSTEVLPPELLPPQTAYLLLPPHVIQYFARLEAKRWARDLEDMRTRKSGYRLIYVCSPYRGESEEEVSRNVEYAMGCSEFVITQAYVPLAPHLLYTRFLNDDVADDRLIGMICADTLLRRCDEIWVFGEYGVSEGMREEFDQARRLCMPYRLFKEDFKEASPNELGL